MRGALRRELTVYDILQKIEEEENFVVVVFYKRVSILTYLLTYKRGDVFAKFHLPPAERATGVPCQRRSTRGGKAPCDRLP